MTSLPKLQKCGITLQQKAPARRSAPARGLHVRQRDEPSYRKAPYCHSGESIGMGSSWLGTKRTSATSPLPVSGSL